MIFSTLRASLARQLIVGIVFFGTLWLGQEADVKTLRLLTIVLAFALVIVLSVYWHFDDKNEK